MLPKNFDWQFYCVHHNDLIINGINDERKCIKHYLERGRKERRFYSEHCDNDEQWWLMTDDYMYVNYTGEIQEDDKYYDKLIEFSNIYYPHQDYNNTLEIIKNDKKVEFRYFSFKYIDHIKKFPIPDIQFNKQKEAVIIECRNFPHLEFTIRNAIRKLGDSWSYTVVCGANNYNLILDICNSISSNIRIIRMPINNLTCQDYSDLLIDSLFWKQLLGEKILIYQDDACIFKYNIDDYLQYDYIGSPWPQYDELLIGNSYIQVGNGGFSLRSKSTMLEILKHRKPEEKQVEDIFFCKTMYQLNIGNLPSVEIAKQFSVENIYYEDPTAGHNWWNSYPNWKSLLYKYVVQL